MHKFWFYCLLYYWRFPLLCINRDTPRQLQINRHFHFLNFPTVSSLLHIRKILVHWPFLEISGHQKWVVGATLALKQKFLAGTLCLLKLHKSNKHFPQPLLSPYSCGLRNHRAQGLAVYGLKYNPLVFHVYHPFGRSMITLLWLWNIGLSPHRFENVTVVYHRK